MEIPLVSEVSLSKQKTISKQRRERAKSDALHEICSEEKIQKVRLLEEPLNFNYHDVMISETKTPSDFGSTKSTKVHKMSLTVQKDSPASLYQNSNKRDLIPVALQKQLNGSRRNKKLSLDETISKLKVPSTKSTAKNLEKMRFLAGVQQQELEAIIRGRASFYSSSSNSPQLNSPLLSHTDRSMSPQTVSNYHRISLNPNPSQFSKNLQEFTSDYNPSVESDMMSDCSRNQMNGGDMLQKIRFNQSNQTNFLEGDLYHQNSTPKLSGSQLILQGSNQHFSQITPHQFDGQMEYHHNFQPELPQNETHFSHSLQGLNMIQRQNPKQQHQQSSDQLIGHFSGDVQEVNNEQSWSTATNQNFYAQNSGKQNYSGMSQSKLNPAELAEQQLMKIKDLLSNKGLVENSQTSSPNNIQPTLKTSKHKKSSSVNSLSQSKLNLASNLNTLQLQSNLVAEKFINSPHQGVSPALSRTNTDPNQLKNLIHSMKAEKQAFNSAFQNELNLLHDGHNADVDQDDGPPLIHAGGSLLMRTGGGGGSLLSVVGGSLAYLDNNFNDGDSLLNVGRQPSLSGGGNFGMPRRDDYEKPAWDPFAPVITSSKTDNTDIANYIRSKANTNFLNPPTSNFKTANFPSKYQFKSPISQPEEPPSITHTKTDPNGLSDLIRSSKTSPSRNELGCSENPPLLKKISQPNPLNSDPLYSNPNFFGQAQRFNTNPTHLASLIKSMHSNNSQKDSGNPGLNNRFLPSSDLSTQQTNFYSTNPICTNSLQAQQPNFQIADSIPSLQDLEVQNPITRTRTDPTNWRSLLKGNGENRVSQFSHQKTPLNFPNSQIISQNYIDSKDATPMFNFGGQTGFQDAISINANSLQFRDQNQPFPENPMNFYRSRTDPTSLRTFITQSANNDRIRRQEPQFIYPESTNTISEDVRSASDLVNKFGNIQVQSSANTLQSEQPFEEQIYNKDGNIFQTMNETLNHPSSSRYHQNDQSNKSSQNFGGQISQHDNGGRNWFQDPFSSEFVNPTKINQQQDMLSQAFEANPDGFLDADNSA